MISTFNAELIDKVKLTDDVLLLSFKVPDSFTFQAGQFISLVLKNHDQQKPRSYSILSPPSKKGKLDLCVKIIPGGFASEIFDNMSVGDVVTAKGPFGHFVFNSESNDEHWFIGAGTGLAPLYSIIKEHLPNYPDKRFCLLMGYRMEQNILMHEELLNLSKQYDNFEYVLVLSRSSWSGKQGHVQQHLGQNLQNKTFYICGLKELVVETQQLLLTQEVKPEHIKFERYN